MPRPASANLTSYDFYLAALQTFDNDLLRLKKAKVHTRATN